MPQMAAIIILRGWVEKGSEGLNVFMPFCCSEEEGRMGGKV